MRIIIHFGIAAALAIAPASAIARPATQEDFLKLETVSGAQISPAGDKVVYAVTKNNLESDKRETHLWIVNADGTGQRQLTWSKEESESDPKFSPDGTRVAFLSSREEEDEETRLWILPMAGGEAQPVEGIEGSVDDFAWSPDNRHLALIVTAPAPKGEKNSDGEERPLPIVIDRYLFKEDGTGYLDNRRPHLWLYDLETGAKHRLTTGNFSEELPAFSPDGKVVAFVSTRAEDPDRTFDSNIYLADISKPASEPRRLTAYEGSDGNGAYPAWSSDGKSLAYLRGGDIEKIWYAVTDLAVADIASGEERVVTPDLDRNVFDMVWAPNGRAIRFIVEDDGRQYLASVSPLGGPVATVSTGERALSNPTIARNGRMALLAGGAFAPSNVHVLDGSRLTKVTTHNDPLLAGLELGTVEYTSAASPDGTEVRGFVFYPPNYVAGQAMPAILNLHGGPTAQFDWSWDREIQMQLAAGYVVVTPNPRGSTGRGEDYALGIDAAWGSVDVQDVLAFLDKAAERGIADPDRLGVSGWSYGGMLTNYVIASDQRFKAAVSGASISNVLAGYGTDHYILYYEHEVGTPWENLEEWMKVSYPFFQNQRIVTPTMFMVGGSDVNVPTLASEQMYQALKSRNIDTRLIVYPDQSHGISRPSFVRDLMKRWIDWLDERVK
jgi:dipeptidyl aminopeptidase/acylaminoacyl peptidase